MLSAVLLLLQHFWSPTLEFPSLSRLGVGDGDPLVVEELLVELLFKSSCSCRMAVESESVTIIKSVPRRPRLFFLRMLVAVFFRELLLDLMDPPRLLDIVKVVDALLVETDIEFLSSLKDPARPISQVPVVVVVLAEDENALPLPFEMGLE
jgi:hypothetical protein